MSKQYENVTVSIDEEFGSISIIDNWDEPIGYYRIKSEKEREDLEILPFTIAYAFSIGIIACLEFPMAFL